MTQQQAVGRAIAAAQRVEQGFETGHALPTVDTVLALGNLWVAIAAQLPFEPVAAAPPCPAGASCYGLDEAPAPDVTAVMQRVDVFCHCQDRPTHVPGAWPDCPS